jgi:transposase
MATRLVNIDRETPMFLPPDLRDWIPTDHIAHFIIDAVERLAECKFHVNRRGSGSEQYPPRMMLALLIYCYVSGRFSSREIETASYTDVVIRYICGGEHHPDHDTICTFRRKNKELFEEAFVEVLQMAKELHVLKKVGTVSVDGSKVLANASKHSAVSYDRALEQIELLHKEVEELMAKAEKADSTPLDDGFKLPDEIARREERIKRLEEAVERIKENYEPQRQQKQKEYEQNQAERERKKQQGKAPRGPKPKPPAEEPDGKMQVNFTDPDSKIMKAGNGQHYEQAYNAQAAVETETMLIVGERVSDQPNDKEQLVPSVQSVDQEIFQIDNVLADSGFYSEAAVKETESDEGAKVYVALDRQSHHVSVADLEKKEDPPAPSADATTKEKMQHRLQTKAGKELYKLRKQTVEPVFGIIKETMGFRRFSLRGYQKVQTEWSLVCLSYNLKRLFGLQPIVNESVAA